MRRLVNARELRKQYEMLGPRETVSRLVVRRLVAFGELLAVLPVV